MKSMEEIIGSLKDIKLKNFALGLQEKLNEAKIAIVQKKKRGQEVSAEESAELKRSVAGYTEKNRHSIPQKVAVLLAAAMLTSMLASCDANVSQGDNASADTMSLEEVLAGEVSTAPMYDTLVVDNEKIADFNPDECGLDVFYKFNFENLAGNAEATEKLKNEYLDVYSNLDKYTIKDRDAIQKLLFGDLVYRPSSANYRFDVEMEDSSWKHSIVFTDNDFVLVSTDSSETRYLTGFVDGVFKNEAGFIDDSVVDSLKNAAESLSYSEILINAKSAFVNQAMELEKTGKVMNGFRAYNRPDVKGEVISLADTIMQLEYVAMYDPYGAWIATCQKAEQIQHNYVEVEQNGDTTNGEPETEAE